MGTLTETALDYFSSLNPLSKKILAEQEVLRNTPGWDNHSREEQDLMIDEYFIGQDIKEKYGISSDDNLPTSFPKHLVNSGEKIVVDFDKECWTWRDEHSSPFCWETRSQQDLNIWEEDDEGFVPEPTDNTSACNTPEAAKRPLKKTPRRSCSQSPEPTSLAFKPERSIWESPFLTADRGLDAGYQSSQASDQSNKSSCEDAGEEEVLKSFGLSLSISGSNQGINDELRLLDSSYEVDEGKGSSVVAGNSSEPSVNSDTLDRNRCDSGKPLDHEEFMKSLEATVANYSSLRRGEEPSVYLEETGESSTDVVVSTQPRSSACFPAPDVVDAGQINFGMDSGLNTSTHSILDEWKPPPLSTSETNDSNLGMKTGFDFLDNW